MQLTSSFALAIFVALSSGCADELDPFVQTSAPPTPDRVADCPDVDPPPACPPWWPACPDGALRAVECRIACSSWTCAGSTIAECEADCRAFRFDHYCPEAA